MSVSSSLKPAVVVALVTAGGIYLIRPGFMGLADVGKNSLKIGAWAGASVIISSWIADLIPM